MVAAYDSAAKTSQATFHAVPCRSSDSGPATTTPNAVPVGMTARTRSLTHSHHSIRCVRVRRPYPTRTRAGQDQPCGEHFYGRSKRDHCRADRG